MEASNQIIGSIIYEPERIEDVSGWITPDMFENKVHKEVYKFCLDQYQSGNTFNALVVQDRFKDNPEAITEISYSIANLINVDVKEAAEQLYQEFKARQVNWLGSKINVNSTNVDAIVERLMIRLEELQTRKEYRMSSMAQIVEEETGKHFCEREMIHIGLNKIDSCLGRLDRGDVTVIGARPAVGKSALVIQIAKLLMVQDYKIGLFELEMSKEQVYERMLSTEAMIKLDRVRNAKNFLGNEEKDYNLAREKLAKSKIMVADNVYSVDEIKSITKKMGFDIVIIDYLQLMRARGTYRGNKTAEIGEISSELKRMASELKCHVILLSQLNRESERKKKPTMADLRESGQIEQDAANIIMLWNLKTEGEKGCEVVKSRHGKLGGCVLKFLGDYMWFEELDKDLKKEEDFEDAVGVPKFEV